MHSTKIKNKHSTDKITDEALVEKLVSGDEFALNELMKRYKHKLYPFIVHYVKDESLAYDLLQEVFIKLYLKADTFNPAYRFSTWLYRITLNLCHDWSRKQKLKNVFSLDSWVGDSDQGEMTYHDVLTSSQDNIEDLAELRQQLALLKDEIPKLPHKLKISLILFALEGYSQEECAKLLGVTQKTIEMRVYRARKILFEKIAKNF